MTQEEKSLLLKDLCSRLPYGVKATTTSNGWRDVYIVSGCNDDRIYLNCPVYDEGDDEWLIESVKPYLRPMSSMTEEEKEELKTLFDAEEITSDSICYLEGGTLEEYLSHISYSFCSKLIDWLNKKMFSYRTIDGKDMFELGLAIEALEGMYK